MSGFISRAACRGRRPVPFAAFSGRERPALFARLLKNRGVARFIVAPDGYGKSSLAIEYAETMFSWAHTFWINAQSPCFIRDLDAMAIAPACFSADADATLVVFDDVPALDQARAEAFSGTIDNLIERGCEVVVTCTPMCDSSASLQRDRIRLGAYDLLLDDAELDAVRPLDERANVPASSLPSSRRIPALAWQAGSETDELFAKAVLREEMPADLLLVVGSALVLRRGTREDIQSLVSLSDEQFSELLEDYPHIGFDENLERFEAPSIEMAFIASPLKKRLSDMVQRSPFSTSDELLRKWARMLIDGDQAARACDLIGNVYPRMKIGSWLVDNAYELVSRACFLPTLRLSLNKDRDKGELRMRMFAIEALCRRMLDDKEAAIGAAKRAAFGIASPDSARILSLLVISELAGSPLVEQVNEGLRLEVVPDVGQEASERSLWVLLAEARCASLAGAFELAGLWQRFREAHVHADALDIVTSWLFSQLCTCTRNELDGLADVVRMCERYVRDRLSETNTRDIGFFLASAALSMEESRKNGVRYAEGPLEVGVLMRLRTIEMYVLAQRNQHDDEVKAEKRRRNDWADEHPGALMNQANLSLEYRRKSSVPILSLKFFGCFDASIGGEPIDKSKFSRKNTRLLLVLLASYSGREVSRDTIARMLWPESTMESAQKNFYTVWSNLREALSLPDGSCPYLLRHQFGCSLERRYVQSDVDRLGEICRELLFGTPNQEQWSSLFSEIDKDFSSEFMPAERTSAMVSQARTEYRNRLVDALVGATGSIVSTDTPQWGIWFARAALKHDDTREDAYVALMRAQIASNQRTAAMMTYLKCRRVLSEKLGIDPSPEAQAMYEGLLNIEWKTGTE